MSKPFDFKTVTGASLAPMAGVADSAFRTVCRRFGAVYTVSEMISSKGLVYQDKKSRELMTLDAEERPAGIQLFGDDPLIMAKAAEIALEYEPEFLDINMGCPVPKVAGNGSGAALMKDPALAASILREVVRASTVPVSVKFRKGWDAHSVNAVEFAKRMEDAGAAAMVVHGRTKAQMYAFPVDLDIISAVRAAVGVPVFGNGGIHSAEDAVQMLERTGVQGVMVAQGALGNPFIFEQIDALLNHDCVLVPPSIERRLSVMLEHTKLIISKKGEYRGMAEARKHAAWYIRGSRGAAKFRSRAVTVESFEGLCALAQDVLTHHKEEGNETEADRL